MDRTNWRLPTLEYVCSNSIEDLSLKYIVEYIMLSFEDIIQFIVVQMQRILTVEEERVVAHTAIVVFFFEQTKIFYESPFSLCCGITRELYQQ